MRKINYIVVHCSATREDRPFGIEELRKEYLRRGFSDIGYHYYICRDGTVPPTRFIALASAHVKGYNKYSIGICYEGGLDSEARPADTRTPLQCSAMRLLVAQLLYRFQGKVHACGHRDLNPNLNGNDMVEPAECTKPCPCFDVSKEL